MEPKKVLSLSQNLDKYEETQRQIAEDLRACRDFIRDWSKDEVVRRKRKNVSPLSEKDKEEFKTFMEKVFKSE